MEGDFGNNLLEKGKKVKKIQLLFIFDRFDDLEKNSCFVDMNVTEKQFIQVV